MSERGKKPQSESGPRKEHEAEHITYRVTSIEVSPRKEGTEDALACREIVKDGQSFLIGVVADGHGNYGGKIARRAVEILSGTAATAQTVDHAWITNEFDGLEQKIEAEFPNEERGGSTVTFFWLHGRSLTIGYVGDSEAKVFTTDGTWTRLTRPHWYGPHPRETRRLDALGAQTLSYQDARENKRPQHILSPDQTKTLGMTRSIGDTRFEPLVSHEPEVATITLSPEAKFLLVASDGLWNPIWKNTRKRRQVEKVLRSAETTEEVRQGLHDILSRWQGDDISVLIIGVVDTKDS